MEQKNNTWTNQGEYPNDKITTFKHSENCHVIMT